MKRVTSLLLMSVAAVTVFVLISIDCFGQPAFFTVPSTPYDRQMTPVYPVLSSANGQRTGSFSSLLAVTKLMADLRAIPYRYSRCWETPAEINLAQAADCKGKAVALYEEMRRSGATNVRIVIGKRDIYSSGTHAWLEWETKWGTYVLDPTFNDLPLKTTELTPMTYIPLYAYDGEHKYRAAETPFVPAGAKMAAGATSTFTQPGPIGFGSDAALGTQPPRPGNQPSSSVVQRSLPNVEGASQAGAQPAASSAQYVIRAHPRSMFSGPTGYAALGAQPQPQLSDQPSPSNIQRSLPNVETTRRSGGLPSAPIAEYVIPAHPRSVFSGPSEYAALGTQPHPQPGNQPSSSSVQPALPDIHAVRQLEGLPAAPIAEQVIRAHPRSMFSGPTEYVALGTQQRLEPDNRPSLSNVQHSSANVEELRQPTALVAAPIVKRVIRAHPRSVFSGPSEYVALGTQHPPLGSQPSASNVQSSLPNVEPVRQPGAMATASNTEYMTRPHLRSVFSGPTEYATLGTQPRPQLANQPLSSNAQRLLPNVEPVRPLGALAAAPKAERVIRAHPRSVFSGPTLYAAVETQQHPQLGNQPSSSNVQRPLPNIEGPRQLGALGSGYTVRQPERIRVGSGQSFSGQTEYAPFKAQQQPELGNQSTLPNVQRSLPKVERPRQLGALGSGYTVRQPEPIRVGSGQSFSAPTEYAPLKAQQQPQLGNEPTFPNVQRALPNVEQPRQHAALATAPNPEHVIRVHARSVFSGPADYATLGTQHSQPGNQPSSPDVQRSSSNVPGTRRPGTLAAALNRE